MDFQENIKLLSEKSMEVRSSLITEEATKNALVLPLLSAWGYDVSNPKEVMPEVSCDISGKNDKVDYAIYKDGKPIIIIECKQVDKSLSSFKGQLSKYFVATSAKFGILTNGIEWRFFSDFEKPNLPDENPFLVFNLNDYTNEDVASLEKFSKMKYDILTLERDFGKSYYTDKIKRYIQETLAPSDEFIRFISKGAGVNDIELCRETILSEFGYAETSQNDLTLDERETVAAVKRSVSDIVDTEVFQTIKYGSYVLLCKYGNRFRWVARIKIGKNKKQIGFPTQFYKSCEWHDFETADDIMFMRNLIVQALDLASFKSTRQQLVKCTKTADKPR